MSELINIDVKSPQLVNVDVSNKLAKVDSTEIIGALGYTPEDVANKVTEWSDTPTDINYPSEKLVKDSIDIAMEEAWSSHVQITDIDNEDVLVYNSSISKFTNRPKDYLTDGGNF